MLTFPTARPQALLNSFKAAVKNGTVSTWEEDSSGDFTHKAKQWHNRAWLTPEVVASTSLRFSIIFAKDESDRRTVYAYYHAHMIETFINHFPNHFAPDARATPNPVGNDGNI